MRIASITESNNANDIKKRSRSYEGKSTLMEYSNMSDKSKRIYTTEDILRHGRSICPEVRTKDEYLKLRWELVEE